jgi:hypothetical protein
MTIAISSYRIYSPESLKKMTKRTAYIILLLLTLTGTLVFASSNNQIMVSRRRIAMTENIRITGTGSGNAASDDDDGMDVDDDSIEDDHTADDDYASIHAGDDVISYDKDCEAIRLGYNISANEYIYQLTYQIDLALEIDGDIDETLTRLEEFLQANIATDLAGCNPNSVALSEVNLQYVLFGVAEDTASSESNCGF